MLDCVVGGRPPPIRFCRLRLDALAPQAPAVGDAGYDLYAPETVTVAAHGYRAIGIGIALALPEGYAGLVLGRSGNAFRCLFFVPHIGLIDSGYRGEIRALIQNANHQPLTIQRGDAIAQLLVVPVLTTPLEEVATFEATRRGTNGFGSSGVVGGAS